MEGGHGSYMVFQKLEGGKEKSTEAKQKDKKNYNLERKKGGEVRHVGYSEQIRVQRKEKEIMF